MAGNVNKRSKKVNVGGLIKQRRVEKKYKKKDQKKFDKLIQNNNIAIEDSDEDQEDIELEQVSKSTKNTKIANQDNEQDDEIDFMDQDDDDDEIDGDDSDEDDDESEEEEEELTKEEKEMMKKKDAKSGSGQDSKKIKSLKDQIQQHKEDLEKLRQKDPSLFSFLGDNEKQLLEFGNEMNGEDSDDSEDDDDDSEDDDDQEDGEEGEEKTKEPTLERGQITKALMDHWVLTCQKELNIKNIKKVLSAFKTASHTGTGETDGDKLQNVRGKETLTSRQMSMQITNSEVFNRVLILSLQNMPIFFDQFLNYDSTFDETSKPKLPSTTDKWPQIEPLAKAYVKNLIHLLKQLPDPKMSLVVLKGLEKVICYVSCFDILPNNLLNILLELWGSSNESVRVFSFLCIRKLSIITPYPFIDSCLKGLYLTYVRNSKFVTVESLPIINFMVNCVIELYGLDFSSSYRHAFIYIRQMAIHLRNTLNDTTHASVQNIYNWLYINGMRAWVELVCAYPKQEQLSTLIYPITQLLIGVITLRPSAQYFPLVFNCCRMLNKISQTNDVFINTVPYLLEILSSNLFSTNAKTQNGKLQVKSKYLNFMTSLSIQDSLLRTNQLREGLRAQVLEVLAESLYVNSYHIGFPELVVPAITHIQRLLKSNTIKNINFVNDLKHIVRAIKQTASNVKVARDKVKFSPKDSKLIDQFTETLKQKSKSNAIKTLMDQYARKNQKTQEALIASKQLYDGEEEETEEKNTKKSKVEDDEDDDDEDMDDGEMEGGEDDDEEGEDEDDEEEEVEEEEEEEEAEVDEEEESRPKKKAYKKVEDKSVDQVEDLSLSDDDE